jgi:hypothetical protein
MPGMDQALQILPHAGALIFKIVDSPLGPLCGFGAPLAAAAQCIMDGVSGKISFKKGIDTNKPNLDLRREAFRKRTVKLFIAQVLTGAASLGLIAWLWVFDEIPKTGTPPAFHPDALQSALLILLLLLTASTIALTVMRARTTYNLDKLK